MKNIFYIFKERALCTLVAILLCAGVANAALTLSELRWSINGGEYGTDPINAGDQVTFSVRVYNNQGSTHATCGGTDGIKGDEDSKWGIVWIIDSGDCYAYHDAAHNALPDGGSFWADVMGTCDSGAHPEYWVATAGAHTIYVRGDGGCTPESSLPLVSFPITVTLNCNPSPTTNYDGTAKSTPWAVDTQIDWRNFDNGGEGCGFHRESSQNNNSAGFRGSGFVVDGGNLPGWSRVNAWLAYTFEVTTAGCYSVTTNGHRRNGIASDGFTYQIYHAAGTLAGTLTSGDWGDSQSLHDITSTTNIFLEAGVYQLRAIVRSIDTSEPGDNYFAWHRINSVYRTPSAITISGTNTYTVGDGATALTAVLTGGSGTHTYQWYSNTENSNSGGTSVGGNSAEYTPIIAEQGITYYYCEVGSTGCGSAKSEPYAVEVVEQGSGSTIDPDADATCSAVLDFTLSGFTFVGGPYIIRNSWHGFGNQFLYDDISRSGSDFSDSHQNISFTGIGDCARSVDDNTSALNSPLPADDTYKWLIYSRVVGGNTFYFIKNYYSGRFFHTGPFKDSYDYEDWNNSLSLVAWDTNVEAATGTNDDNDINRRMSYYAFNIPSTTPVNANFDSRIKSVRHTWNDGGCTTNSINGRDLHGELANNHSDAPRKTQVFFTRNNNCSWGTKTWNFLKQEITTTAPDLTVTNVSYTVCGEDLKINSIEIKNLETATAALPSGTALKLKFRIGGHYYTTNVTTTSETVINGANVLTLEPFIISPLASGAYELEATVNADKVVPESDCGNNTKTITDIKVVEADTDITIQVKGYEHNDHGWAKNGQYYVYWWDDCTENSSGFVAMSKEQCSEDNGEYWHYATRQISNPINIIITLYDSWPSSGMLNHKKTDDLLNITESKCYEIQHAQSAELMHTVNTLDCASVPCTQISTGINEINGNAISVFPVPASDMLYISGISENDNVVLTDLIGKILLSHKGSPLDVSMLPSGVYLLKAGAAPKVAKVVKK
ncbi:MAG: hypothetical protein LBS50_07515 [Prevotellaceae bacterium]|jgi:hypothetical protein|nr:hypothetical protein [Prevotellaceae bacterium]